MRVIYSKCPHVPQCEHSQRGECIARTAQERKRVKHTVTSGEVPHLWFHKAQFTAKNGNGSLYFEGPTIFSYGRHFPIAHHVQIGKRSAVLFTTKDYSVTTSGHKSAVRMAIPEETLTFHVPNVWTQDKYAEENNQSHSANIADYVTRIANHLAKCARARQSFSKEWEHKQAVKLREEARAYAKFFRLKLPKIAPIPALDSEGLARIKAREAAKSAEKAKEEKARKAELAKQTAELVDRWRNGQLNSSLYNVPIMLRICGEEVETSQGARIPVSHALRALRFVREVIKRGEAFQTNGHKFPVGVYQLDRVEIDGTIKAGCHVISYAEIERLAPQLETLHANTAE
jgi:hypothetical protein